MGTNCLKIAVLIIAILFSSQYLYAENTTADYSQEELRILGSRVADNGRSYRYPSIMIEHDFIGAIEMGGKYEGSLCIRLMINNWELSSDKYGHHYKYTSPEITYGELKTILNFSDIDVVNAKTRGQGQPHSFIKNNHALCEITYIDDAPKERNNDSKLTAVVINIEQYIKHQARVKSDEEAGWLGTIARFIRALGM